MYQTTRGMKRWNETMEWIKLNGCLIPAAGPATDVWPEEREARRMMRRRGALMMRCTASLDRCTPGEGWFIVKERFGGLEELSASTRSKVRRALRRCSYRRFTDRLDPQTEHWEIYSREEGRRIGFALVRVYGREVFYDRFRADARYLRGYYPLYGLLYEMNRHYLAERKLERVSDGFRTMRERSGVQLFLVEKFRFRRAYCRTALYYRPWFGSVVRTLYPFRDWLPGEGIRALMRQHGLFGK